MSEYLVSGYRGMKVYRHMRTGWQFLCVTEATPAQLDGFRRWFEAHQ
jgi:hypothetical protein